MKSRIRSFAIVALILLDGPALVRAGMPSWTLDDMARMRLSTISFFLVCLLGSAWIVGRIWNALSLDFPRLPRLSYGKALGLVTLWGFLFLLVLTMISGARELMTPGAWKKDGYVYKLDEPPPPPTSPRPEDERRHAIDRLRIALCTYAEGHGGRFPSDTKVKDIPSEVWHVPDPSGITYVYLGGKTRDDPPTPMAYEPGIFGASRMVLLTNGEVVSMTLEEIRRALTSGGR